MAARKKPAKKKTKPAKSKTSASKKTTTKLAKKKPAARSKAPKRKAARKKAAVAKKATSKQKIAKKAVSAVPRKPVRKASPPANRAFPTEKPTTLWGRQSGDLQGVSGNGEADSETVDELLEEGNAFEADAISGVEEAGDKPERPVRTRQVSEDDVPDEYLEKD